MPRKRSRSPLRCIICSGGCRDAHGAYTVCALCVLAEPADQATYPEEKAA